MEVKPYKNHLGLKNKFLRVLWNFAYILFFRFTPNPLFWTWRVFILRCFGASIGKHCKIRSSASFWAPWNIELEDYVSIGPNAKIYSVDRVVLKTKVCISQGAYLCTASHDITNSNNPLITAPISIESFSWIAADAFIGMGVTVGQGAVVGARSAVFKSVEPWTVVGGNPAKLIKKRIINET
ncbi:MAG: putative colanic acid biosynthesis acetyltransferase [Bacteroidales bacterium]|nr:putative colanic acid biosynthesis acetyltransferase [Bacteroidales bacterium]